MNGLRATLRTVGSLWLGAVLLLLILAAMAYATVFESVHGTEQALAVYYRGGWFQGLLGLLALNAVAALLARFPYTQRQIGFLATHAGLLVTLAGTLVTHYFAVDGQIGLVEGQTSDRFFLAGREALILTGGREPSSATLELSRVLDDQFAVNELAAGASVSVGDLRADVLRYLPDSDWQQQAFDDNATPRPAIEVALASGAGNERVWVLPNQAVPLGTTQVSFRPVADLDELRKLVSPAAGAGEAKGLVVVERGSETWEFPVEQGLARAIPLGESGCTARVLRYLPHATVGPDKQIVNASDSPANPYVEVELNGPQGREVRRAFARFPDFEVGHAGAGGQTTQVRLLVATDNPTTPVEILGGPDGALCARLTRADGTRVTEELKLGAPAGTEWGGPGFTVLRRFDHARVEWVLEPIRPVRAQRTPGILVRLNTRAQVNEIWLQKDRSRSLTVDGVSHEVSYADLSHPLGFQLTLERFRIGRYPGSERPRTFESHVSVADAGSGRTERRVISMNNSFTFGGYTLYQTSYRQEGQRWISFLNVARDPGKPIVFTGYGILLAGMVVVLVTRMTERRPREMNPAAREGMNPTAPPVTDVSAATIALRCRASSDSGGAS